MIKPQIMLLRSVVVTLLIFVSSLSIIYAGDEKFFTKEETLSHTTNKTEEWSKGAGFYSPDGKLLVVWKGKKLSGTWRVKDNGEMCVTVAEWGEEDCHKYKSKNDAVQLVYKGKGKTRKTEKGNQLESYL